MKERAFHQEHIVDQIKKFFSGVHDMTDFYYKLYLLNALCKTCDGRGYLDVPEHACPDCEASGDATIWHRARLAKQTKEDASEVSSQCSSSSPKTGLL